MDKNQHLMIVYKTTTSSGKMDHNYDDAIFFHDVKTGRDILSIYEREPGCNHLLSIQPRPDSYDHQFRLVPGYDLCVFNERAYHIDFAKARAGERNEAFVGGQKSGGAYDYDHPGDIIQIFDWCQSKEKNP